MNTTLGQLKLKVLRLIGEEAIIPGSGEDTAIAGTQTSADTLKDAIHAALGAICERYPKRVVYELTNTSESFDLPADCIEIEAVYSETVDIYYPEMDFVANSGILHSSSNTWDADSGVLEFATDLEDGETLRVTYSALWTLPDEDSDDLEPPEILATALALYGAYYVNMPFAALAGGLAQYKTKVDSGNPTDNPLTDLAKFFLQQFEIEMKRIPARKKGRKS